MMHQTVMEERGSQSFLTLFFAVECLRTSVLQALSHKCCGAAPITLAVVVQELFNMFRSQPTRILASPVLQSGSDRA